APGDFAADDCADDAVYVSDGKGGDDFFFPLDSRLAKPEEGIVVEGLFEAVVLRNLAETANTGGNFGLIENFAEVEALGFPVVHGLFDFEPINTANHFIHLPEPELRHQFANFL